jgi:hypothetical protein
LRFAMQHPFEAEFLSRINHLKVLLK